MKHAVRLGILFLAAHWTVAPGSASDIFAFRFHSSSASGSCAFGTDWRDDLIFHNMSSEDAAVQLIEMTGGDGDRTAQIQVPAGRTVSLADKPGMWKPTNGGLWIVHLDVPDGVVVRSRAGAFSRDTTGGIPPSGVPDLGAFSMPVFPGLVAPGRVQLHLGADLGAEDARINVGVYNGGVAAATITIEVHAGCDDSVLESRTVSVPAGNVEQVGNLGRNAAHCPDGTVNTVLRYVTVAADQPTLSYVTNLQNDAPCLARIPYSSAGTPADR